MDRYQSSLIVLILFLFIGLSIIPSSGVLLINIHSAINSNGTILYVGGDGHGNYSSIQAAIDNASVYDTVFVYNDSSPYNENVKVDKPLSLIGEDRNTTIIKGNKGSRTVVFLGSDVGNVLVSGFTITEDSCGISIRENNNIIKGNKIVFNKRAIFLDDNTCNTEIINNFIIHNSEIGIWDDDNGATSSVIWNVIGGNGKNTTSYIRGGIYKHGSGGIYHHNDFDFNYGYNAYTEQSGYGTWDDGLEGNYWDNWEGNPGYPDVYIIPGDFKKQYDYHPKATSYFSYTIVLIEEISYEGNPGESIQFKSEVNKPDSSVSWFWEFGDGTTSNEKNPSHSFAESGIYNINVTVTDTKGQSDMDKCIAYVGIPPDKPIIKGPTKGRRYYDYDYFIVANDSDSDYLNYYIDWGDYHSDHIGPYPRGEEVETSHMWEYEYNYTIMVKAIDETHRESEWANFNVSITRNKAVYNSLFLRFLEYHPHMFPMLRQIIGLK